MEYTALDRRFIEFGDTEDAEEAAAESLHYQVFGQDIKWRDVHSHRFVVILGEAGTGKTREFEEEAQRLRNDGRQALFIPLEDLADNRISVDVEKAIEDWKQGAEEGIFFLDAVDEARLGHPVAFRRALDALARLLRPIESRSTIVVSCRISDWQYRTDAKTMVAALRSFGPGAASGDGQPTTPLSADGTAPDAPSVEAWLHVDAIPAVSFLEDLVAERGESPSSLVQKLATSLGQRSWGSRDPGNTDYLQSQVLERLIPLVNAHIRVEDDPDHDGVYEINEREHAQSFRNALPQHLANQKGADAQRILQNLAASFDDQPEMQTYCRRLAEQQAAMVVEYPPRSPQDVAAFGAGGEMDPKTGDELYEIALDRLNDIREDTETGDFSDRHLFSPGMPEKDIQIWLSGRLHRERGGMYSVTREEEIVLSQETDIRLHHPAAGCVTIEIKPVESGTGRYSFNQLVAALQGQLVGQYMRAAESSHGILVVAMLEPRQWNPPEGGSRIRFPEVLDRLNAIASEIVQSDRGVEKLCVIGIDFSET